MALLLLHEHDGFPDEIGERGAAPTELRELTGLTPSAVPPFGSLFGLPTHCDSHLAENERVNFNTSDHTISVSLGNTDYLQVEKPTLAHKDRLLPVFFQRKVVVGSSLW